MGKPTIITPHHHHHHRKRRSFRILLKKRVTFTLSAHDCTREKRVPHKKGGSPGRVIVHGLSALSTIKNNTYFEVRVAKMKIRSIFLRKA
jgi:hypothetical protein